jgi:N-acyl-D-amino-acid deacylase
MMHRPLPRPVLSAIAILLMLAGTGSSRADPGLGSFDRMMGEFMEKHHPPGAALAVTDHGRLIYARGFGQADTEQGRPVSPTSLFRIASISKPITAVAVLRLAEQGKLSLADRVFDLLKYEPPNGSGPADERLHAVTVRLLLQHRGGWDRDVSFDPMFRSARFAEELGGPPPAQPEHVIRAMLAQRLDFAPGERYAYSNFGYCLLGRVIECASGSSYEDYVKQHVLAPLGIRTMRLGRTRLADRHAPDEVRYYDPGRGPSVFAEDLGQEVPRPYGAWCLEAMDAHGGWLASAVDLARFACAFDDPDHCPILTRASFDEMYARPEGLAGYDAEGKPKDVYYSLGWLNRVLSGGAVNRWHTGSLPGTATILIRRHDGRNFVALLNSRVSPRSENLNREIDPLLHRAADEVRQWPEFDLFEQFSDAAPPGPAAGR